MTTPSELASEPDVYRGPTACAGWWESFLDAMDSVALDDRAACIRSTRTGRLIEFVIHARGRSSGIETEQRAVGLATVDGGKLVGLEFFTTLDQARAAAGPRSG